MWDSWLDCVGLFHSYIVAVHQNPGKGYSTLKELTFAIIVVQRKEHKFDLKKCRSHAHSVQIIALLRSWFKYRVCRHCHNHCMINIFLQKYTEKLNVNKSTGVHNTQPTGQ